MMKTLVAAALAVAAASPSLAGDLPAFDRHGDGPQKVIMLHDWFGSAACWDPIRPWLDTERFTYVFIDARGYGRSQHLTGFDVEHLSSDVFAVADTLGWDRFHLVGHSMNGHAVLNILVNEAQESRRRLASVTAIAPVPPAGFVVDDATRDFFESVPHDLKATTAAFEALTGSRLTARFSRRMAEQNIASSTEAAMRGYLASLILPPGFDERASAVEPTAPVLVIAGSHDMEGMRPQDYESSIPPLFPNARIVAVESAGHYLAHEVPVLLVAELEKFFAAHAH